MTVPRPCLTALRGTPEFTHGAVRDIRVRWAFEEMGRTYDVRLFDGMARRPDDYRAWQPFGQVPALADGGLRLFESGAILLWLGEQDARLLPADRDARWLVTSWLFAGLNSVEPALTPIVMFDIFYGDRSWAKDARPSAVEFARSRLADLERALGDRPWLAGGFSIADIVMVTVLRLLRHTDIVAAYPKLAAYQARGEARPAFRTAEADQIADITGKKAEAKGEMA